MAKQQKKPTIKTNQTPPAPKMGKDKKGSKKGKC